MATFTAFLKIYSTKHFCNANGNVTGRGEIFDSENFLLYGICIFNFGTYLVNFADKEFNDGFIPGRCELDKGSRKLLAKPV